MFSEIVMIDFRKPLASRSRRGKLTGPYRWTPSKAGTGRGFYQASNRLAMDGPGSSFDLRLALANDFLSHSRLSHVDGYFCDTDGCGDTLQPIIARLPSGRGFLAGWTMGDGMCASLGATIYRTEEDAAYAAHGEADSDAERMRDASEEDDTDA